MRWWIGGLLFASTVINYLDRQTFSVLAPYLKTDYGWTNTDYALVIVSFRAAYAIGQTVWGRIVDRLGTRRGLTISVVWYSVAAMLTSLAVGLRSFMAFRFLLGAGEAANWPAATKAVSEWFPRRERGWAVALFDSGSSIGGAIAPVLVVGLYKWFGGWRGAFVVTGLLGFVWLAVWRLVYHPPESHPRVSDAEREMLLRDREADLVVAAAAAGGGRSWRDLLSSPRALGVIAARTLTDPVWFFVTDWFAVYLKSKSFDPEQALVAFWIPFVAADLGNFFGGGVSSWLVRRGWPVLRARKAVVVFGGLGMATLGAAVFASSLYTLALLFAVSTFAYAAFSTMALVLPSDLFPTESVATVSGLSGTGAGLGTILSTLVIGAVTDRFDNNFEPILVGASLVPLAGMALVLALIRDDERTPPPFSNGANQ